MGFYDNLFRILKIIRIGRTKIGGGDCQRMCASGAIWRDIFE